MTEIQELLPQVGNDSKAWQKVKNLAIENFDLLTKKTIPTDEVYEANKQYVYLVKTITGVKLCHGKRSVSQVIGSDVSAKLKRDITKPFESSIHYSNISKQIFVIMGLPRSG